jgi:tellurite resistance protein TehA-like permease
VLKIELVGSVLRWLHFCAQDMLSAACFEFVLFLRPWTFRMIC